MSLTAKMTGPLRRAMRGGGILPMLPGRCSRGFFGTQNQVLYELRILKGSMDNMKTGMDASIRNLKFETNLRMDNIKIGMDLRVRNLQLMIFPFYLLSAAAVYAFADRLVPTQSGGDQKA
jgi:hypothetical protein